MRGKIPAVCRPATFVVASCLGLANLAGPVQAATFTWLGDLPGGTNTSTATAVSADGQVVVGYSGSANGEEAFRYENGVMTGLGDLPGRMPYESRPTDVSADGSIVAGTSGRYGGTHRPQAFLWNGGALNGLGYLPNPSASPVSFANALSDDGTTVVGASSAPNGVTLAVHRNGAWEDPGAYPTFFDSYGTAISPDGGVIAGESMGEYTFYGEAFLIIDAVITPIGDLPGGVVSAVPTDVAAGGAVVVGFGSIEDDESEAFRFAGGVMAGLGFLPGGINSGANGVSADGTVVVGGSDAVHLTGAGQQAFIWTEAQGMQRLEDVLVTQSAAGFNRWRDSLVSARAVSADGLTIVGVGFGPPGGQAQAWRAVLDSPVAADSDDDGILDGADNCSLAANPTQLDTDGDSFGNACDGDLNDSGLVTASDYAMLRSVIGQSASSGSLAEDADLNGSGTVTAADYAILRSLIGSPPGPSGLAE